ncbi:MAG: hypothetical protein OEO79_19035, partial [Gemmatimonadota bacterium]|nr:hypothetical protein [Gemmatimonadota bacterium]
MSSVGPILQRAAVTLLAVVAVVAQINYLDALAWHRLNLTPPMMTAQTSGAFLTLLTAHAVVSIASAVLAVTLVVHEGARQAAARALGLALGSWAYLLAYSGITLLMRPLTPGPARMIFEGHFLLVELAGLVGLLRFTALFPRNLLEEPPVAPSTLPAPLVPFHAASVWMLRPAAPWIAGGVLAAGLWVVSAGQGGSPADAALSPVMDVFRITAAGLTVLNLRRSWGRADHEGAVRLSWLLVALASLIGVVLLYIGGNVLVGVTEWPEPNVAWRPLLVDFGVLGFLIALAMSVMYRGEIDPRRLARRMVASAVVVTVGLFLAAALEAVLSGGILAGI